MVSSMSKSLFSESSQHTISGHRSVWLQCGEGRQEPTSTHILVDGVVLAYKRELVSVRMTW